MKKLAALLCAAFGCRRSPCPECGKGISTSVSAGYVRCPRCRRYASVTTTGLASLRGDFVAESPVFSIPFEDGMALPLVCCVCSRPATRKTVLGAKMGDSLPNASIGEGLVKNALLGAGLRPMIKVSVAAPHCDEHEADALIRIEDDEESRPVVRVRSYPCYRAAVGL